MTPLIQDNEAIKIIARSSVKRMILEHLVERGGMMPSELAGLLETKLPNITAALKDLSKHYLVYQTNPGSTKGKVFVLTKRGLDALSELRNSMRLDLIRRFRSSLPSNSKGRVLSSSSSQMKCIFNIPVRRWDYVSGKFNFDMKTYITVGIVNEVQVQPRIQLDGRPEVADEQVPSSYLVNVIILDLLSDQESIPYAPLIPIGNNVDIASEEYVRLALGLAADNSEGMTFGTTLGRPHFPVTFRASAFNSIMIGDIPRGFQIDIASKLITDLIKGSKLIDKSHQGLVICFTRNPDELMNVNGIVIKRLEEFHKAHLDELYKEVENTGSGKFLVIDSSSPSEKQYPEIGALHDIIDCLNELRGNYDMLDVPVSLVIDEADRFFVQTEQGIIAPMFVNLFRKGMEYFYHQIFLTRSPFLSNKLLGMTGTLLVGSSSISSVETLEFGDYPKWFRHISEQPFRKMLDIRRLRESDYMLLSDSLRYPILLTVSNQQDNLERETELKEQLIMMTSKQIKDVNRNTKVQGATATHQFDLSFNKSNNTYLIKYEYIDQNNSADQITQATEWVFPTIDITSSSYKLVFVYSGRIGPRALKILEYYYDEVMPFEKFTEFLRQVYNST